MQHILQYIINLFFIFIFYFLFLFFYYNSDV